MLSNYCAAELVCGPRLDNQVGLVGTVYRHLATMSEPTWMEPSAALSSTLKELRWTVVVIGGSLLASRCSHLDRKPSYPGKIHLDHPVLLRAGRSPQFLHQWQDCPVPPTLEKVKAHDEASKIWGNHKFWGNEEADHSAKAAGGGGAASFVEDPRFADAVQVRDRDGQWIRDVSSAGRKFSVASRKFSTLEWWNGSSKYCHVKSGQDWHLHPVPLLPQLIQRRSRLPSVHIS